MTLGCAYDGYLWELVAATELGTASLAAIFFTCALLNVLHLSKVTPHHGRIGKVVDMIGYLAMAIVFTLLTIALPC